jgi:hypothetical protein
MELLCYETSKHVGWHCMLIVDQQVLTACILTIHIINSIYVWLIILFDREMFNGCRTYIGMTYLGNGGVA